MATFTVPLLRAGSTDATLQHNLTITGTATYLTDYTVTYPVGISGTWAQGAATAIFPIGVSQINMVVNTVPDTTYELNETIVITLSSTSPVTGISSLANQAVLVITNDDLILQNRWVGLGVKQGTTLAGTITNAAGAAGLDTIGVLRGYAGVWPNYVSASAAATLTNTYVADSVAYNPAVNQVAKYVTVAPIQSPAVGEVALVVSQTNNAASEIRLYYGCTTAGQWRLFIGASSSTTATAPLGGTDASAPIAPGQTSDVILVKADNSLLTSCYIGNVLIASNVTLAASGLNRFDLTRNAGLAAMSVTQGLAFNASTMFPITLSNL